MKILVLCEHGNNRSVTVAHHLKYWKHDVLSAGVAMNSPETLATLFRWADRIIATDREQAQHIGRLSVGVLSEDELGTKVQLWNIGPDIYPRPFNKELLAIVKRMMEERKAEYKP